MITQPNNSSIFSQTKVLITGATGFTGSFLVKKLVNSGAKVVCIARTSSNIRPFQGLNIEWIRGNVYDEDIIEKAVEGVSYIFHVAAAYREAKIANEEYYNVHVKSTQLLARKALQNNNFKRFIHISTIGVHSHIANPPANEDYPFNPGDIYQKTKADAELWLRDFSQKNGLPVSVVRPCAIFGENDKRLLKIFRMASKKWFPILGYGKCLYHLIHVDDLTDFILLTATHPKALGEVFICGNTSPIPLTDMVKIISKVYDVKPKFLRLPAWPFFALGFLFEFLFKPLHIEPPIYRRRVAFYTKDRAFDTAKMKNVLNYEPKYDNETGIEQTAKWYLDQGWINN